MFFLDAMRAAAILLITNSHFKDLQPARFLATGGMIGNDLFFFISGFGLTLSLRDRLKPFQDWYAKRLLRIYEPLVIVTLFLVCVGFRTIESFEDGIRQFIFPFEFWFLPSIALMYIPAYLIIRYMGKTQIFGVIVFAYIIYIVGYIFLVDKSRFSIEDNVILKSINYFIIMVVGIYVAKFRFDAFFNNDNKLVALIASVILFFGFLFVMNKYSFNSFQVFTNVFGLILTYTIYSTFRLPNFEIWLFKYFSIPVNLLSSITLQIYLLQEFVISNPIVKQHSFPINIIVVFLLLIPLSFLFSKISILKAFHYIFACSRWLRGRKSPATKL